MSMFKLSSDSKLLENEMIKISSVFSGHRNSKLNRLSIMFLGLMFVAVNSANAASSDQSDKAIEYGVIDHILLATNNLDAAVEQIKKTLDIDAEYGGKHPAYGTENYLFSLGGRSYVEIAGAQSNWTGEENSLRAAIQATNGPEILGFAVETSKIEEKRRLAKSLNLDVSEIIEGSRVQPNGKTVYYRGMVVRSAKYKGLVPFFIEWVRSEHPGLTSPKGAKLKKIKVIHPEPEGLRQIYEKIGVAIDVKAGLQPQIQLDVSSPKGDLMIIGAGSMVF